MKIIKGFENEDIIVSDFGEWVGNDYIDYKAEYKRNQKFIEVLFDENKQLKDNWNKLKEYINKYIKYDKDGRKISKCLNAIVIMNKINKLEQGSDSGE